MSDKDRILQYMRNGEALKEEDLLKISDDAEAMLEVIKISKDVSLLAKVSDRLKMDTSFISKVIKLDVKAFDYVSEELKNSRGLYAGLFNRDRAKLLYEANRTLEKLQNPTLSFDDHRKMNDRMDFIISVCRDVLGDKELSDSLDDRFSVALMINGYSYDRDVHNIIGPFSQPEAHKEINSLIKRLCNPKLSEDERKQYIIRARQLIGAHRDNGRVNEAEYFERKLHAADVVYERALADAATTVLSSADAPAISDDAEASVIPEAEEVPVVPQAEEVPAVESAAEDSMPSLSSEDLEKRRRKLLEKLDEDSSELDSLLDELGELKERFDKISGKSSAEMSQPEIPLVSEVPYLEQVDDANSLRDAKIDAATDAAMARIYERAESEKGDTKVHLDSEIPVSEEVGVKSSRDAKIDAATDAVMARVYEKVGSKTDQHSQNDYSLLSDEELEKLLDQYRSEYIYRVHNENGLIEQEDNISEKISEVQKEIDRRMKEPSVSSDLSKDDLGLVSEEKIDDEVDAIMAELYGHSGIEMPESRKVQGDDYRALSDEELQRRLDERRSEYSYRVHNENGLIGHDEDSILADLDRLETEARRRYEAARDSYHDVSASVHVSSIIGDIERDLDTSVSAEGRVSDDDSLSKEANALAREALYEEFDSYVLGHPGEGKRR